ncbi:MAG: hypothetical protein DWH91_14445 [Planctomycetota bacterium]|nr:MAG: hypothetical protein DWH91_14445 [Planctomycetota bacterium]
MIERANPGWEDVLWSIDSRHPVIQGDAIRHWPPELVDQLMAARLLTELPLGDEIACPECPEAPFRRVIFRDGPQGTRAMLSCPQCGVYELPPGWLRRWKVERLAFLTLCLQSLSLSGKAVEQWPDRLWRLGRMPCGESHWSVWLGMNLRERDAADVLALLPQRALLLVPTRLPKWAAPEGLIMGSIRELTHWKTGLIRWDIDRLQEMLEVEDAADRIQKPAPTRRQTRAADIEALVGELKQHLRAARDHAYHTLDASGVPALLPRPSQKDLSRRIGVTESRISRSLNDPEAQQLQLLWNLADDLDGVMRFGR